MYNLSDTVNLGVNIKNNEFENTDNIVKPSTVRYIEQESD